MTFTICRELRWSKFCRNCAKRLTLRASESKFCSEQKKGSNLSTRFCGHTTKSLFCRTAVKKDGFAEEQPIFISANEDNANNASLLILADGAMPDTETLKQYERILNIFDGNDETALNNARAYWKQIKALDGELHYWQQNDRGVFEQKA